MKLGDVSETEGTEVCPEGGPLRRRTCVVQLRETQNCACTHTGNADKTGGGGDSTLWATADTSHCSQTQNALELCVTHQYVTT